MDASRDEDRPPRGSPPPPGASSLTSDSTNHVGFKSNNRGKLSSSFRSLGRMLQYLHEQTVTVELKNGIRYRGMLDSDMCDDNFNVTLRDVHVDVPHHHQANKKHQRLGSSHHHPPHREPREKRNSGSNAAPVTNLSAAGSSDAPSSSSRHPHPPNSDISSSPSLLLSVLQVRGSQIRYILLGDLDLNRLVASGVERERRARSAHQRTSLQPKKPKH